MGIFVRGVESPLNIKIDELLIEAIGKQSGLKDRLDVHLSALRIASFEPVVPGSIEACASDRIEPA